MFPYIHTPFGEISVFAICVSLGTVFMVLILYLELKKQNRLKEIEYILPKIAISGMAGYVAAAVYDFIFKFIEYGVLKIYGISFYGGLLGAMFSMWLLLKITSKRTKITVFEWLELLVIPFIVFHIFGRIACFFGGCCYGKYADNCFTVCFPNNESAGIFHNGRECYPTQLFEALTLILILLVVMALKNKFKGYLILYSVARFMLEFLRGDDRGAKIGVFSPSQWVSLFIFTFIVVQSVLKKTLKGKLNTCSYS